MPAGFNFQSINICAGFLALFLTVENICFQLFGWFLVKHVYNKTCLVCDSINTTATFSTEACQETLKIQKGPLNCDSEKLLYLLKCKVCGEVPYVGKAKTKFCYRFNSYKSKHRAFREGNQNVTQKRFHAHYCLDGRSGIEDWNFVKYYTNS